MQWNNMKLKTYPRYKQHSHEVKNPHFSWVLKKLKPTQNWIWRGWLMARLKIWSFYAPKLVEQNLKVLFKNQRGRKVFEKERKRERLLWRKKTGRTRKGKDLRVTRTIKSEQSNKYWRFMHFFYSLFPFPEEIIVVYF